MCKTCVKLFKKKVQIITKISNTTISDNGNTINLLKLRKLTFKIDLKQIQIKIICENLLTIQY